MRGLVLVALVLSGCLSSPSDPPAPAEPPIAECSGAAFGADVVGCMFVTGFGSGEPTLGITSTGAIILGPAQPTPGLSTTRPLGVAISHDVGATWDLVYPDVAGRPVHQATQDPYLYVDPTTDRIFFENLAGANCATISWSDDEGVTWQHSVAGCSQFDHQTLFAGPPRTTTTMGYPNVVYRCAANAGALAGNAYATTCQRSDDGGMTWLQSGAPAFIADPGETGVGGIPGRCEGVPSHGAVTPSGLVLVPKGHCGQPFLAISEDDGLTWKQVQVADNGMPKSTGTWAHDAGTGGDAEGNLYYFWIAEDRLPYLVTSEDGGTTWSEPWMVGPPGLVEAQLPSAIVGAPGHVAWTYMGSFDSPGAPWEDYSMTTWHGVIGATTGALEATRESVSVTVNPLDDPLIRGPCGVLRCQEVFDFIDIRIHPDGTPWGVYVDGCTGPCATGEEVQDNDAVLVAGQMRGIDLWAGDPAYG